MDAKLTAQADFDAAKADFDAAKAQVDNTVAALHQAQTDLEYTKIMSPIDGVVVARQYDVGQTVAASFQAPTLFTIAQDLTKMQVQADVDQSDIGRIKTGQTSRFTVDAYPEQEFIGTISQIRLNATVNQNVITYPVILAVPNPDEKLRPQMTANVTIEVAKVADVLRVPNAALRFRPTESQTGGGEAEGKGAGKSAARTEGGDAGRAGARAEGRGQQRARGEASPAAGAGGGLGRAARRGTLRRLPGGGGPVRRGGREERALRPRPDGLRHRCRRQAAEGRSPHRDLRREVHAGPRGRASARGQGHRRPDHGARRRRTRARAGGGRLLSCPLVEIRGLVKVYRMGEVEVRALDGVDLADRGGRVRRDHGALGLRQVAR